MVGDGSPQSPGHRRAATAVVAAAIAAGVLGVYAQVGGHDFVEFDDDLYVVGNAQLALGPGLEGLRWALQGRVEIDGGLATIWQPLTWISYLIDHRLHGLDAAGPWLLTNVAWHLAAAWMLWASLASLTGRFWPSACVGGSDNTGFCAILWPAWSCGRPGHPAPITWSS